MSLLESDTLTRLTAYDDKQTPHLHAQTHTDTHQIGVFEVEHGLSLLEELVLILIAYDWLTEAVCGL